MIRLNDLSLQATAGLSVSCFVAMAHKYNPLINYDWSTTTAQEYKTDGVELITNGGFDTDSDWIKSDDNLIMLGNGNLSLEHINTVARADQTIPLEIGCTYIVRVVGNKGTSSRGRVYYGVYAGNYQYGITDIYDGTFTEHIKVLTATSAYLAIQFRTDNVGIVNFKSISVQKVLQEPNKVYSKNLGTSNTPLALYFGRGVYLNGVDQTITVPINTTIQTSLKRVNGIVTINETSQTLTNYVISGLGVHKDYYLFTRLLTTAEKDSYTNTPELFYAMAQADNTCVLNMPMCETDGYARNMKGYSLGSELPKTVIQERLYNASNSIVTNIGDYKYNVSSSVRYGYCKYGLYKQEYNSNGALVNYLTQGKQYLIEVDITVTSGSVDVYLYGFTTQEKYENYTTGTYKYSAVSTVSSIYSASLLFVNEDVSGVSTWTTSNLIVKEVTGIYPITNYTSSVRDNAKKLQYGLQTCKFVRDSLGVIQSASDYLACDGVGYANTGWIPSSSEDWTIECGFIAKMDNVIKRIGCGWTNSTQVAIGETTSNRVQAYVGNKQAITTITNPNVEIILVKSNGYALIYINKVQITNELIGLPFSPDEEFRLSGHRLWSPYPWNNTITKFKVHNKALTNEEIQAL